MKNRVLAVGVVVMLVGIIGFWMTPGHIGTNYITAEKTTPATFPAHKPDTGQINQPIHLQQGQPVSSPSIGIEKNLPTTASDSLNAKSPARRADAPTVSPFRFESGPPEALQKINARLMSEAHFSPTSGILGNTKDISIRPPMARIELTSEDVMQGGRLEDAKPTLWYVIESSGNPVAGAKVTSDDAGNFKGLQITYPPNQDAFVQAMDYLASLDQFRSGSYAVNLVICYGASTDAIWLKNEKGQYNLVYTFGHPPPPLQSKHLYSPEEFMANLRTVLETQSANNPGPDPLFQPMTKKKGGVPQPPK